MKNRNQAFTLIELLIVISILMILSGVMGKVYSSFMRSVATARQHTAFYTRGQFVLERLSQDIRQAVEVEQPADALLELQQYDAALHLTTIVYRKEAGELIREERDGDGVRVSQKVVDLEPDRVDVEVLESGRVKITWFGRYPIRPLAMQDKKMITFVGGKP